MKTKYTDFATRVPEKVYIVCWGYTEPDGKRAIEFESVHATDEGAKSAVRELAIENEDDENEYYIEVKYLLV